MILKMNINMTDITEKTDNGELVTNRDQLQNDEVVVTTPVESRIMSIRGNQIMIDRDLAELYGVETKRLNEAVKRNIERFPERFRFQLTKEEMAELVANCDQLQNDEVVVTTPVESRIISIRGKQIMIDRDLAELYGVETRVLNQAVKRNMERFPERFRFQLTKEEMNELVTNCDRFNSLKHSTVL